MRPTKTLFVIKFDPINTRTRDLEKHFDPYGKILNIRIRRNFAFIQYESQEDATKALDATNMRFFPPFTGYILTTFFSYFKTLNPSESSFLYYVHFQINKRKYSLPSMVTYFKVSNSFFIVSTKDKKLFIYFIFLRF